MNAALVIAVVFVVFIVLGVFDHLTGKKGPVMPPITTGSGVPDGSPVTVRPRPVPPVDPATPQA